jgi:hypothetical protein
MAVTIDGSNAPTAGGVIYGNGTNYVSTSAGTIGQFLQSAGSGAPVWATLSTATNITRTTKTSNYTLQSSDKGNLVVASSGTFTFSFDAAATLGASWCVYLQNAGTGDITLDPNGSETIDGLTSYVLYPNETRLVVCSGTAFFTTILQPGYRTFTSTGTFTVPPGISMLMIDAIGAGGGGGRNGAIGGGGGGGGGRSIAQINPASLSIAAGTAITVTVGTGGTGRTGSQGSGTAGGDSSFGSYVTAGGGKGTYDGTGSPVSNGGAGGGSYPNISSWTTGVGYGDTFATGSGGYGQRSDGVIRYAGNAEYGGGGGSAGGWGSTTGNDTLATRGGSSVFGGGGGGGGYQFSSYVIPGGAGGVSGSYSSGGGAAAGTAGANYMSGGCGGGGGGGATDGGAGGAGGVPGGGGGGGGGASGNGANGGRGEVRVYWR